MASITINGTYGPYNWLGAAGGSFAAQGTWGGATVKLYFSLDKGVNLTELGSLSANGQSAFNIGLCDLYIVASSCTGATDLLVQASESVGANPTSAPVGGASESTTLDIKDACEHIEDFQSIIAYGGGQLRLKVDDTTNPLYVYIGQANPTEFETALKWRIKRVTSATGDTSFADDSIIFNKAWNVRTGYTYK